MSSYELLPDGSLAPISESVENHQTTTCWLVLGPFGRFAYTTNNGQSTVSSYHVHRDGSLSLLAGVAAVVDSRPVDLALTRNGGFLYTLNAGTGTIAMFRVDRFSGALTALGSVAGLPADDGAVGMAVR